MRKPKGKLWRRNICTRVSNVKDALGTDPVIMLEQERSAWAEFKMYAWIAGASTTLTEKKACILRLLLNLTPICVLSKIIAIIFDTGASSSLTPFLSDFKEKIKPCFVQLQAVSSGLIAKGKGTIEYNFVGKDGKMVTVES